MITSPATGGDAPFAATIEPIGKAQLEDGFFRLIRYFFDPERKSVKIKQETVASHQSASRNMRIAKQDMTAYMLRFVGAGLCKDGCPPGQVTIISIHQLYLTVMNGMC